MRESIWLPRFRFIIISGNSQKSENVIKCHRELMRMEKITNRRNLLISFT